MLLKLGVQVTEAFGFRAGEKEEKTLQEKKEDGGGKNHLIKVWGRGRGNVRAN